MRTTNQTVSISMSADDQRLGEIESRLDTLEHRIERLQRVIESNVDVSSPEGAVEEPSAEPDAHRSRASNESFTDRFTSSSESERVLGTWFRSRDSLNYVGVALLLFGLAFLFQYSIEQGWLVPRVRIGFGGLVGGVLLAAGTRIYHNRVRLRQVLLGGSIATFYGTVFAAYQLYALVSYSIAFGAMGAVTVLSIVLALRQDDPIMAVIGTMGGLGTPFLLYADVVGVSGLAVYTSIIIGGATAIYIDRGWLSLLYAALTGGWIVLLVPCAEAALTGELPSGAWALQGSLVVAWLLLGGAPVLRSYLRVRGDHEGERPNTPVSTVFRRRLSSTSAYAVTVVSPCTALLGSRMLWSGSTGVWLGVATGGALLYGLLYGFLRQIPLPRYASPHGLVAALLATYAVYVGLGGRALFVAWAVEGALFLALARRLDDQMLQVLGHAVFGIVGLWLGGWLVSTPGESPALVSADALQALAVLVVGVGTLVWIRGVRVRWIYRALLLVGWLGWWWHELVPIPNGHAYISVVWGTTAVLLLLLGIKGRWSSGRRAGLVTLALFVVKLFLIDLSTLPALWQIGLFLGTGGGFLFVSYVVLGPSWTDAARES